MTTEPKHVYSNTSALIASEQPDFPAWKRAKVSAAYRATRPPAQTIIWTQNATVG